MPFGVEMVIPNAGNGASTWRSYGTLAENVLLLKFTDCLFRYAWFIREIEFHVCSIRLDCWPFRWIILSSLDILITYTNIYQFITTRKATNSGLHEIYRTPELESLGAHPGT